MQDSDANRLFPTPEPLLSIFFCYSALVPVKSLSFPSNIPFNVTHEFFLREILLNHHLKQYPPSESYQQSFWKWAIIQLESFTRSNEDAEVDERIYAHYLSLRTGACSETPPNSFITYHWRFPKTHRYPTEEDSYETITLLESRTTIEAGTTGLRTWRASLVLAQYLVQHPYLVNASNVLELGSGTGFIGILVASLQLQTATPTVDRKMPSVYLTDVNSTVLVRCRNNVRLPCNKSSPHPNMQYKSLDWLDSLSGQENLESFFSEAKVDIVLGADIVFDPALVPPLVKTIFLALLPEPTQVAFIALTVRNEETLRYFLDEIGKVLQTEEVTRNNAGSLLLQIPDQVDAELEVKIFKVTRGRDTQSPTNCEELRSILRSI
ncbi:putative methyltransferase-domain-containing protein [Boletus reticuloceps]|uniref:Putative methyltransferase-domain-containing protein n=1 Tax=Boletus reticuloceps TaxID=495285 RepID=A0A8I3AFT1_9AGAM|nr:putative methyltransferase-domain-containing protein [Boletus reticuloceps]